MSGPNDGSPARGIRSIGAYIPRQRLDRSEIAATFGKGGGPGIRAVASFDEDTTTMAVEACRAGSVHAGDAAGDPAGGLWFATTDPAYADKTNAAAIHAALGLDRAVAALDFGGGLRSGIGALTAALDAAGGASGDIIVAASDRRGGLPTSADESGGCDGAGSIRVGTSDRGPLLATLVTRASATTEILDRWRTPGSNRSHQWEERFAEATYVDLASETLDRALQSEGLDPAGIDTLIVTGMHARAVGRASKKLGAATVADNLDTTVGNAGIAQPFITLTSVLEESEPDRTVALVHLADGCDVIVLRTTDHVGKSPPRHSVKAQIAAGRPVSYGRFLSWRGQVEVEPPNRPGPNRVSAPAAQRRADWKFRFTGTRDRTSGMLHLPPARVSEKGGAVDDMEPTVLSDTAGTVAAVTVDRLAYSTSPPVVFAVIDFDGGGRAPLEMTDTGGDEVEVGDRVEPTFRRLSTADGIHNYFWKVRKTHGEVG